MKRKKILLGCALSLSLSLAWTSMPAAVMAQNRMVSDAEYSEGMEGEEDSEGTYEASKEDGEKQNIDIIYVGGEAASDANTGATAESPVASLSEAVKWVNDHGKIMVIGDIEETEDVVFTKSLELELDEVAFKVPGIHVEGEYIIVSGRSNEMETEIIGNGANNAEFTGRVEQLISVREFETVTLNQSAIYSADAKRYTNEPLISCKNLNYNGNCFINGYIDVNNFFVGEGSSIIYSVGDINVDSLSVEGELLLGILGKIGENMEEGIVVMSVADGVSEETMSRIGLAEVNSINNKFILVLENGKDIVTAAHTHTLSLVEGKDSTCTEDGTEAYYTCPECGGMYMDEEASRPIDEVVVLEKLGHEWSDTLSYDETGHWYGCNHGCDEKMSFEEHKLDDKGECDCGYVVFEVLEGEGSSYTIGSEEGLKFRFNASVEDFKELYVDGNRVDPSDYKVESGSVVIVLSSGFLDNLSVGDHTLTVEHTYGTTEAGFKVTETEEEPVPDRVEGLKLVSTGKKKITMSWDPVADIEGKQIVYVVYGKKGDGDYEFRGMSSESTFTDKAATGLVKTEYKVRASYMSDDGTHRVYGPDSGTITSRAMLSAPENVKKAAVGKNRVALSWDAVEDADGYLIYAQKNGKYGYCGMTSDGRTSFTDVKALDTDYNYYWVFAYYYEEDSEGNNKISAGIPSKYVYCKGVLPAVSNLKARVSGKGIRITWDKLKDADGYIIYRKKGSEGKFEYVYIKDADSPSYYDTRCAMEGYNYYRVYPYHMNGDTRVVGVSGTYVYAQVNPPHEHVWEEITEMQDQGTDEPVYGTVGWKYVCNGCKVEYATVDEIDQHMNENAVIGNEACMAYTKYPVNGITGYEHRENWVEVVIGYRCTICGAEKSVA